MVEGIEAYKLLLKNYRNTLEEHERAEFDALSPEQQVSLMNKNADVKLQKGSLFTGPSIKNTETMSSPEEIADAIYSDVNGLGTSSRLNKNLERITSDNILDVMEYYKKNYGETVISAVVNEFGLDKPLRKEYIKQLAEKINTKYKKLNSIARVDFVELDKILNKTLKKYGRGSTTHIDDFFDVYTLPLKAQKFFNTSNRNISSEGFLPENKRYEASVCENIDDTHTKINSVDYAGGKWSISTEYKYYDKEKEKFESSGVIKYLDSDITIEFTHKDGIYIKKCFKNGKLDYIRDKADDDSFDRKTTYDLERGKIICIEINEHYKKENNEDAFKYTILEYDNGKLSYERKTDDGNILIRNFFYKKGKLSASSVREIKKNGESSSEIVIITNGQKHVFTNSISAKNENGEIFSENNGTRYKTAMTDNKIIVENLSDNTKVEIDINKLLKNCNEDQKEEITARLLESSGRALVDLSEEIDKIEHQDNNAIQNSFLSKVGTFLLYRHAFTPGGSYNPLTNLITGTEATLIHELGHAVDARKKVKNSLTGSYSFNSFASLDNQKYRAIYEKNRDEFKRKVTSDEYDDNYAATNITEMTAEAYDLLMTGSSDSDNFILEYFSETFLEFIKHYESIKKLPLEQRK